MDDVSGYDTHTLQMYEYSSLRGGGGEGGAPAQPLTLSAGALSLSLCPVSGRVMVLLANGVLIVVRPREDGFELVLELVRLCLVVNLCCVGALVMFVCLFARGVYVCVRTCLTVCV